MDDEFDRIAWLTHRLTVAEPGRAGVRVGIGDDAAVLDPSGDSSVITVDTQVEGTHFEQEFLSARELGVRSVLAATCDVWAMGATPTAAVVALTLPAEVSDERFRELVDGLREGSDIVGAQIVGGNLSGGPILTTTTTVLGRASRRTVLRSGARPGDRIYVTGTIGASALGLAALKRGATVRPDAAAFVARWRRPPDHGNSVEWINEHATASIDVSDGLVQDLHHICQASGVGAVLHAHDLPVAEGHDELSQALGLDAASLALSGGEDYEVLFTVEPGAKPTLDCTCIGRIVRDVSVTVLDESGKPLPIEATGFRHFS